MPQEEEFKETKVDRELFGVFREHRGNASGDPFNKDLDSELQAAGAWFAAIPAELG